MKKGISPLVAAVILIAFVVAVAGIASTFFTDITVKWSEQASGGTPVECAFMRLEILDVANETNNDTVTYRSMKSDIQDGVSVTVYDNNDNIEVNEVNNASLDAGEIGTVAFDDGSLVAEGRIEVASIDCREVTDTYTVQEEDL